MQLLLMKKNYIMVTPQNILAWQLQLTNNLACDVSMSGSKTYKILHLTNDKCLIIFNYCMYLDVILSIASFV
jgi:hypothetical protein